MPRPSEPPAPPAAAQRVVLLGSFAISLINFRGPLIREMIARGHKVFALSPDIDEDTRDKLLALGATPVEVQLGRTSLNPRDGLRTQKELRRLFQEIGPDVVIAYTIKPIVLGAVAARAAGVPRFVALVTGLGYPFTKGLEPKRILSHVMARLMYRRAFRRADVAIFQNADDRDAFRRMRLTPGRLTTGIVNGSGIDLEAFAQMPVPSGASFLMIGRLLGDKGIREFGQAARRLKKLHPDLRISLAGWIDPSPNAISQAELEALVEGGVNFLGRLEDVRGAIAAHSVHVLPSYREGTPRSVLEALAVGRAIITTDAPGCRETVMQGENGFIVAPRDPGALFGAMLRFVEEPEFAARMGPLSRRLAEHKYDVRKVNAELLGYAAL